MSGYAIGGIFCILYAFFVIFIAFKKPVTLWKIVKLKLGKKTSDKAAEIFCYIFALIFIAGGIYLFTL